MVIKCFGGAATHLLILPTRHVSTAQRDGANFVNLLHCQPAGDEVFIPTRVLVRDLDDEVTQRKSERRVRSGVRGLG